MRISKISVPIILFGLLPLICTGEPVLAQSHNLPANEQIMYGGKEKNAAQKAADQKFLAAVERRGISRRDAAIHASKRGFQFLRKGDLSTAIKRFNQAWLLDAEYGGAYWGFAVVLHERDKNMVEAERMFVKAGQLLPEDADLQVDHGRFFGKTGRPRRAIEHYEQALSLNGNARDAHAGLASARIALGEFRKALAHAKMSVARNEYHPKEIVDVLQCFVDILDRGDQVNDRTGTTCMSLMRSN